jgi:hypothetical protein
VTGSPDEEDLDALRDDLRRTADISDPTEQMLEIAGVVDSALRATRIRPIVVGGLAVAYWTTGLYLTGDIDVVMPSSTEVEQRLATLGFERDGRFWTLPGRDPVFEAPGSTLEQRPPKARRRGGYDFSVNTRFRTYAEWRADREANAVWIELVDRALPAYERRRPRAAKEADLLRKRGTPERLIGPTRPT